jgi:hypothetical protein
MTIGRISGPLLKANLVRDGVDLAFETDLLYLDVTNARIGIKTASPSTELEVDGTVKAIRYLGDSLAVGDVSIEDNEIKSIVGNLKINPATEFDRVQIGPAEIPNIYGDVDIQGNIYAFNLGGTNLDVEVLTVGNILITGDDPDQSLITTLEENTNLYISAAPGGRVELLVDTFITGSLTVSNTVTANKFIGEIYGGTY